MSSSLAMLTGAYARGEMEVNEGTAADRGQQKYESEKVPDIFSGH